MHPLHLPLQALLLVTVLGVREDWQIISGLLPAPTDPCESTTTYAPVTVTHLDGHYIQRYTLALLQPCDIGFCPHDYTITQTCEDHVCRFHDETALPPGFTKAAVVCPDCGGHPCTETLTFPTESAEAFKAAGYQISPIETGDNVSGQKAVPGPGGPEHQGKEGKEPEVIVVAGASLSNIGLANILALGFIALVIVL